MSHGRYLKNNSTTGLTKIKGLYLSGQDCLAGGFLGAVTSGLLAAHEALDRAGRARLWAGLLRHGVRPPSTSSGRTPAVQER